MNQTESFKRSATFERDTYNDSENTIEISFSSEEPYLRSNGYEILSHDPSDVDFSRIEANACPFLLDHNTSDYKAHIGVIQRAWLDGTTARAIVKFSDDAEKQGIINDIKSGVRPSISVGYSRYDEKLIGQIDGIKAYRYKFAPYEVSSVSCPADVTIGVFRNLEPISNPNKETKKMENPEIKQINENEIRALAIKEATQRAVSINDLCGKWNMSARAAEFIASEKSFDEIRSEVLTEVEKRSTDIEINKQPQDAVRNSAPAVHTREKDTFNVARALEAAISEDWTKAGYEKEMSQEGVRGTGQSWNKRTFTVDLNQRADSISVVGTAGSVGNLVDTNYRPQDLIDVLWAKTALSQLPVHRETGLKDNQLFPVVTSKASAWIVGETGAIGDAESVTTTTKFASPKQMVTKSALSLQAQFQTTPSTEAIIYRQIFEAIALKLDQMLLAPTQTVGELTSLLAAITGGQVVAGGTNGAAPSRTNLLKLQKILSDNNISDAGLRWLTNRGTMLTLGNTLNDSANTNSGYIIPLGVTSDSLLGKPVAVSNNVPASLTKGTGTGLSPIIAGDFSEFFVGQWSNLVVKVDETTGADNSTIFIRSYSFWDFLIKRLEAFAAIKDVITI
jgi:HK97 family phage major capsid protein